MTAKVDDKDRVVLGGIAGAYGIKGWVKLRSYTQPQDNILDYAPWWVGSGDRRREMRPLEARAHGKGLVVRLEGVDDRDAAQALNGEPVSVPRDALPALSDGEYYWADLIGLEVLDLDGRSFGRVSQLMETGANDVLVVRGDRERLIPFLVDQVVKDVDLEAGELVVDWDADF